MLFSVNKYVIIIIINAMLVEWRFQASVTETTVDRHRQLITVYRHFHGQSSPYELFQNGCKQVKRQTTELSTTFAGKMRETITMEQMKNYSR